MAFATRPTPANPGDVAGTLLRYRSPSLRGVSPWNIALMNKELAVRATWSGTHGLPSVGLGGCGGSKGSMIVHGSSLASSTHGAESNVSGGF